MKNIGKSARPKVIETLEARRLLSFTIPTFTQTNLVSDGATPAASVDPNLVNPWGLAFNSSNGNIWVADNGAGVSTIYSPAGAANPLVVTIPPPAGSNGKAAPTGTVFHKGSGFNVTSGGVSGPSQFIFATEDGTISGWNPATGNAAVLAVDDSASSAVFKGIAIAGSGRGSHIYVTDFRHGTVDVFDSQFQAVNAAGAFSDPSIPAGFAPFGIQNLHNKIYVTYAKQNGQLHDDVAGLGNGFVDVFTTKGKLIRQFVSMGNLNSPWAVAQGVGKLSNDILIGNFGDGKINIFDSRGNDLGTVNDSTGAAITIEGLWGLLPGQGKQKQSIFFAAGTNGEADGLYGTLTVNPTPRVGRSTGPATTPPATLPGYSPPAIMGM